MSIIYIKVQYFNRCPNSSEMIRRVREAIAGMEDRVYYEEILIETNETAEKMKFRVHQHFLLMELIMQMYLSRLRFH